MTTIDATVAYLMGRYRAILRIHGNSSMERREAEEDDFKAALRTALTTAAGGDTKDAELRGQAKPVAVVEVIYGKPVAKWLGTAVTHGEFLYKNPYINEADKFLRDLNVNPEEYRTQGGWFDVPKICEYMRENLAAIQSKEAK